MKNLILVFAALILSQSNAHAADCAKWTYESANFQIERVEVAGNGADSTYELPLSERLMLGKLNIYQTCRNEMGAIATRRRLVIPSAVNLNYRGLFARKQAGVVYPNTGFGIWNMKGKTLRDLQSTFAGYKTGLTVGFVPYVNLNYSGVANLKGILITDVEPWAGIGFGIGGGRGIITMKFNYIQPKVEVLNYVNETSNSTSNSTSTSTAELSTILDTPL